MDKTQVTVVMELERETKGAVLYKTDDYSSAIQNIYVKKHALPKPFPTRIEVTVTAE